MKIRKNYLINTPQTPWKTFLIIQNHLIRREKALFLIKATAMLNFSPVTLFLVKFLCVLILVKKKNLSRLPLFRKYDYDTLKIEHHAHGAKSNDPVINKHDDDKLIIKPDLPLRYTYC